MGKRDFGKYDFGKVRFWESKILGKWDFGRVGFRESRILRKWDFGILQEWDVGKVGFGKVKRDFGHNIFKSFKDCQKIIRFFFNLNILKEFFKMSQKSVKKNLKII